MIILVDTTGITAKHTINDEDHVRVGVTQISLWVDGGRDHGITPQAASALRRAWADAQEALGRNIVDPNEIRNNAFRDSASNSWR